jgi:hypothetical protein
MSWNITEDSENVRDINVKKTDGRYSDFRLPYLEIESRVNYERHSFTLWIDPKDLTRVAGMLRSAAEQVEAFIEEQNEKEEQSAPRKPHLRVLTTQAAAAA